MADVSSTIPFLRGLGLSDPLLSSTDALWEAQTSATEQTPRVGEAVPQQTTSRMVLATSGTQSTGGSVLIQTQSAGHPRPGQGGFIQQDEGDTDFYGWDIPTVVSYLEHISWTDGTASDKVITHPDAVGLDNNRAVVVARVESLIGPYLIKAWTRSTAGAWSSATVQSSPGDNPPSGFDWYPCLADLGDGVVLCAHWVFDTTNDEAQIRVHRSTDSGATWDILSSFALSAVVDTSTYTVGRLRMAYTDDQVLLIAAVEVAGASNYTSQIMQFASDSRGRHFDLVEIADDTLPIVSPDVVAVDRAFLIAYIGAAGYDTVYTKRIPFAAAPFSEQTAVDTSLGAVDWCTTSGSGPTALTDGECSLEIDDAGAIWFIGRVANTGASALNQMVVGRSNDGGKTWDKIGKSTVAGAGGNLASIWAGNTVATIYPIRYAPFWCHGRMMIAHNHEGASSSYENSLSVLHVGGWSSVNMPPVGGGRTDTRRVNMVNTWAPYDDPEAGWWVANGAGTSAVSASGDLEIDTVANTRYFSDHVSAGMTSTIAQGFGFLFGVRVDSGGSDSTTDVSMSVTLDDGANGYQISLRMGDTAGVDVYDDVLAGGTSIGSSATAMTGDYHWFIVWIASGKCSVWRRTAGVSDRWVWTNICDGVALSDSGGAVGNNVIEWGHRAASTASSAWIWFAFTHASYAGNGLATGQTNPDDLFPRYYGGSGRRIFVRDGVRVTALTGPADEGDQYLVTAGADYPVKATFFRYSPTPRRDWRSVAVSPITSSVSAQTISYYFDSGLTASGQESRGFSDTVGFAILGTNARDIVIRGYTGAAWSVLATTSTVVTTGIMVRDGVSFRANSAHTTPGWIWPGELVGGTIYMITGALATSYTRINSHTEGGFFTPLQGKPCIMYGDGVDSGDPTSGVSTSEVWSPNICILINLKGADYAGFQVQFPSQVTATGDLRAGLIVPFWLMPFGFRDANGWTHEVQPGVQVTTTPDGMDVPVYVSPGRRIRELSFSDPMDLTAFNAATPAPDWFNATENANAEPLASRHDSVRKILGHWSTSLTRDPVVWIDRVDRVAAAASDVTVLRHLGREFDVCTAVSPFRMEHITGRPLGTSSETRHGELVRGSKMTLRGVV